VEALVGLAALCELPPHPTSAGTSTRSGTSARVRPMVTPADASELLEQLVRGEREELFELLAKHDALEQLYSLLDVGYVGELG